MLKTPKTGKSLALLCSVLAWVYHQKKIVTKKIEKLITKRDTLRSKREAIMSLNVTKSESKSPYFGGKKGLKEKRAKEYEPSMEEKILTEQLRDVQKQISEEYKTIPKVYYGTRTHRQIKQIIKVCRVLISSFLAALFVDSFLTLV